MMEKSANSNVNGNQPRQRIASTTKSRETKLEQKLETRAK